MKDELSREVARTLEVDPELLPYVPELLADLAELGTSAHQVVECVRAAGVKPGETALDLGCGKGTVAVALAERLGLVVEGVDAMPDFVRSARALAARHGVGARCTFREADLRTLLRGSGRRDVVLLLAVGPILGDHRQTIEAMRGLARPGGLLVLDDAYLAEGAAPAPGYERHHGREETLRALTAFGDRLLREVVTPPEREREVNRCNTDRIRARARRIAAARPDLAPLLDAFVARQERETDLLGGEVVGALWLLRRGDA